MGSVDRQIGINYNDFDGNIALFSTHKILESALNELTCQADIQRYSGMKQKN